MNFINKIKNLFRTYKSGFLLSLLAAVLLFILGFQYASYYSFHNKEHAAEALKTGQRVVIDLQDPKWFPKKDGAENEIIIQDDIKFSADGKQLPDVVDDKDLKDVAPESKKFEEKPLDPSNDDALTLADKEKLLKKQQEKGKPKPEVKAIAKDKISAVESKGSISVIITNMGLKDDAIKAAGRLSKEFTLSFTPYGQFSTKSSIQLSEDGYSILAELPMESTVKREDGGKFSINDLNDDQKNMQNFEAILSIVPTAVGFVTPVYEDFSDRPRFENIMKMVTEKKTSLVYQGKTPKKIREYAAIYGLDAIIPDIVIDEQASVDDINAQLKALETIAMDKGSAIGIAHPYPITFDALEKWQATLAEKKITLTSIER